MVGLQSKEEYDGIIEELATTYTAEIADNGVVDIATSVISSYTVKDRTPHVKLSTTIWGGENEVIHKALLPSEVLLYSDSTIPNIPEDDTITNTAIEALIEDLENEVDDSVAKA